MSATISNEIIETVARRVHGGEKLTAVAAEMGLSWQRLVFAIRKPKRKPARAKVKALRPVCQSGALPERYRPATLDAILGQTVAVCQLKRLAANPRSMSLLFEGDTGTGKTTAAVALAAALGCDVGEEELGGLTIIASGEQTADSVRETWRLMHLGTLYGSGWKVVILNEADRMSPQAETIWLDRLEALPPRTVVIFTTNNPDKMQRRFRDRSMTVHFESEARQIRGAVFNYVAAVYAGEVGRAGPVPMFDRIVADATVEGKLSFRRALQGLEGELMARA